MQSMPLAVAVTCPLKAQGETPVFRHPESVNGLLTHIKRLPHINTLQELHEHSFKTYADVNCLGTREKLPNGTLGEYKWKTYKTAYENMKKAGSAILNLNLAPIVKEKGYPDLRMVAIYAKNCEEWVTIDIACSLYGIASIPIFDTLGMDSLEFIFKQTGVSTIFTSGIHLDRLIQDGAQKKLSNLATIVCFDGYRPEQKEAGKNAQIQVLSWNEFLSQGEKVLPLPKVTPDTIFTLAYTSGTTGTAKAAILTHGNLISVIGACEEHRGIDINTLKQGDVHLSYLPLAHIFEREFLQVILSRGISMGFFGGDPLKLTEDMQILKPTYINSVPRIYNKFYETFQAALQNLPNKTDPINPAILQRFRMATGGRAKFYVTGSAPIAPDVMKFLRMVFGVPFMEGFGQTETCSACFVQAADDTSIGNIGGTFKNTEFKLVDLPDMNYTSKDKGPNGESMPRGELCLRGPSIFKGYYKEPEKTAETIDADGWHHTGDVAVMLPSGAIKLIDRKKNIFKLAQAEFVAPDKIENIYLTNNYVTEIYVYGDSFRSNLVAIVVPDPEHLKKLAKELGITNKTHEELCKDPQIIQKILDDMTKTGKNAKLASYELAKNIYLEPKSFVSLELTTPSMKLKRDLAKVHFKQIIEMLYSPKPKL